MKTRMVLKKIFLAAAVFMSAACLQVEAAEKPAEVTNPMDWNISMMDSYKGDKYVPSWSVIEENNFGIFAYDMNSVSFLKSKKTIDKNIVECTVKTVFTNKEVQKQLKQKYMEKLQPKEKPTHWILQMRFNISDNTYIIKKTEYMGSKGTVLDTVTRKPVLQPIPEESFASRMYNICKTWAEENKDSL